MKKEEIVSTFVMIVVCVLVMVGFTIAWYTTVYSPVLTGLEMDARDRGSVKIALTAGGSDISELEGEDQYADIEIEAFTNLESGKLAPGTYGKVVFYLTPSSDIVSSCDIVPKLMISQDGTSWYPNDEQSEELETLYSIAQNHICFFADEEMTTKITEDNPFKINWTNADDQSEKDAVMYWKWYYEYPYTDEELSLSENEKAILLEQYDEEDMKLGNNISGMKFHFKFLVQ